MTQLQTTTAGACHTGRRQYGPMLAERRQWGLLLADALSHLQETSAEAVLIFERLLAVDAELATFRRYDRDLNAIFAAEDRRLHQPPDVPDDHAWAPCSLCLKADLGLDLNVVLPKQARLGRVRTSAVKVTGRGVRVDRGFTLIGSEIRAAATEAVGHGEFLDEWLNRVMSTAAEN